MNIQRNVLSILAGAALLVSLPAGAQVLGGGVGGALNGTFGSPMGGAGIHGAGSAAGGVDASGAAGRARERASQIGNRGRDVAAGTAAGASKRAESTRGAAAATAKTAPSASVGGGGAAGTEQRALGRSVGAHGAAGSQTSADRSAIASSAHGEAAVSAK